MHPNQHQQLKSWAEERDEILRETAIAKGEKNTLLQENKNLVSSNMDLAIQIATKKGQLEAYSEIEQERATLVSQDLALLGKQKGELDIVIASLIKDVATLTAKKSDIETSLAALIPVYERVTWQINQLTETVDKVVSVNSENTKEVNTLIATLKKFLSEIGILNGQ